MTDGDPYSMDVDTMRFKLRHQFGLSVAVRSPLATMAAPQAHLEGASRVLSWNERFASNLRGLVGGHEHYDPRMTWADSWRRRLRLKIARELGRDERSLPSFDFFLRTSSGTPVFADMKTEADR